MRLLLLPVLLLSLSGCAADASEAFLGPWSGELVSMQTGDVPYDFQMPITITFEREGDGILFGAAGCQPRFDVISPSRAELAGGTCLGASFTSGTVRISETDLCTVNLVMVGESTSTTWHMTLNRGQL